MAGDVCDSTFSGTKMTNHQTSYMSTVKKSITGTEPESGCTSGDKQSRIQLFNNNFSNGHQEFNSIGVSPLVSTYKRQQENGGLIGTTYSSEQSPLYLNLERM
jgi:hypothetical protein